MYKILEDIAQLGSSCEAVRNTSEFLKNVELIERDPILKNPFLLGEVAAAALGVCGAAISKIWELKTGQTQTVRIDASHAALSLRSFSLLKLHGYNLPVYTGEPSYPACDLFRTKDERSIFLHGVYPHHRDAILQLLNVPPDRNQVADAVAKWDSQDLEEVSSQKGFASGIARTAQEWNEHPQGKVLRDLPLVEIIKIGDSDPKPFPEGLRPLSGLKVLDLTHVLAGPTAARLLAENGAEVLRISSPHRPFCPAFVMDTGHGKRSAILDLKQPLDLVHFKKLAQSADMFCHSYRSGSLEKLGLSPTDLAKMNPGIICMSLNCFGSQGPFKDRLGWEQVAQAVSGMAIIQGTSNQPVTSPPVATTDYLTAYLAVYGMLIALMRRASEGGSYLVRCSLAQTGMWVIKQGQIATNVDSIPELDVSKYTNMMQEMNSPFGKLLFLRPAIQFSATPSFFMDPSSPMGAHEPQWS